MRMRTRAFRTIAIRLTVCLSVLGVVSAIPAAASTLDLNTGNGTDASYTITADTLLPPQGTIGTTAPVVTSLGFDWTNDLSSEWIAPTADQSSPESYGYGNYYVTYETTFSLPTGLDPGSTISITFLADDWATATLDGDMFYTGPSGCYPPNGLYCTSNPTSWVSDTVLTIPSTVDDLLTSGPNTLSFTVWNIGGCTDSSCDSGGSATGLDAQVAVDYTASDSDETGPDSPVPEPPTALTFASALAIGLGFWRLKAGRQTAS